jgi:hypothetical protein
MLPLTTREIRLRGDLELDQGTSRSRAVTSKVPPGAKKPGDGRCLHAGYDGTGRKSHPCRASPVSICTTSGCPLRPPFDYLLAAEKWGGDPLTLRDALVELLGGHH